MTIFVLIEDLGNRYECDGYVIVGVFTCREDAENVAAAEDKSVSHMRFTIEEHELTGAMHA